MKLISYWNGHKFALLPNEQAKEYLQFVTLSTQDNAKLLQQLKFDFKRKTNWNKYQTYTSIERQNPYLDYLIDPSFRSVNILFILSFENEHDRKVHTQYFLPKKELKDHNAMIVGQNFFDQPVKNYMITYDDIRKIVAGRGGNSTSCCLLGYPYFKEYYKIIAIDLSKQQALDADPKPIQQINFTGNLERDGNTTMTFFIIEEVKETVFRLFKWKCESIGILFCFNLTSV